MTYHIEIEETLQRVVKVEADTKEEAIDKVVQGYCKQEIILDDTDLKTLSIKNYKEVEDECNSNK